MSQSRWDRFFFLGFVGIFFFIFVSTESSANGNYNVAAQFPFSLSLSFSFSIKKKGPDGPVSYFEWPSLRDHSLLPQTKEKTEAQSDLPTKSSVSQQVNQKRRRRPLAAGVDQWPAPTRRKIAERVTEFRVR